jgi:D-alanyl-D-alanine carboxypeptidase
MLARMLLVPVLLVACAALPVRPAPDPITPKLAALVDRAAAAQPGAGLAVAVLWRGKPVLERSVGLADRERETPVDAATMFRIGSITKQVAAALVLRLAAAGRLGLDDDLGTHLPEYPTHGRRITLRHLLTHTSGIADYERAPWLRAHMDEDRPLSELIASFAAEPFRFESGAEWSYSNANYLLLGEVIERVTHRPFARAVDDMLAALGITGVRYCPDEQTYPHAARAYADPDGTPARAIRMKYAGAAGAMCATATGLAAWGRALAGGKVVDAAAWRAMTTPVTLADGSHYGYGFGVFVGELGAHRTVFHNGGINGFAAMLATYPDDDLYIAVLTNSERTATDPIALAIAREVLAIAAPTVEDLPVAAAEAQAIAGTYEVAALGASLVIELVDGKLHAREASGSDRAPLAKQRDGSFAITGTDGRLTFQPGRLELVQGGMHFSGKRVSP